MVGNKVEGKRMNLMRNKQAMDRTGKKNKGTGWMGEPAHRGFNTIDYYYCMHHHIERSAPRH